jgi:hypothetical protein
MKKWTKLAIPVAAVAALVGWYAFRPERLVVNRRVDEGLPTTQGGPVGAASGIRTVLQHFAPHGRYRNHFPDGRWHACSPPNEFQYIKRS